MDNRLHPNGAYPDKAELCLPGQRCSITGLRAADPAFAEACEDYELLMRELSALPETAQADRKLILDSLQGLVREIETTLRRKLDVREESLPQEHKTGENT